MNAAPLRYDERQLVEILTTLSLESRTVFAATCAERLLPAYRWFHQRTDRGDPGALEGALTALWSSLMSSGPDDLAAHRGVAEMLVPDEDESWVDECAFAQHSASAVVYAIQCRLTGDPQAACWAARQAYDALDYRVTTRDDVDINAPGVDEEILGDPLIQAELRRQERDIAALRDATGDQLSSVASQMRSTARSEGASMFGLPME